MNRLITLGAGLALIATPLVATALVVPGATASDSTAERKVAYSVTAKINKTTAIADEDTVKVRGKVSPRAAGDKVVLQQRMEGKKSWSVSGTTKIKANGTFLLKDEPSTAGTRIYRVLKPAAGKVKKGFSKELELVVYKWERLGNRSPGANENVSSFSTATIGTVTFGSSLMVTTPGTPAYVEYTLGRLCTSLRTTYALDDSSASGATGGVKLFVDGVARVDQPLVVGQIVESSTGLTGAFRLRYELTSNAAPVSKPTVATPEVLCTK